MAARLGPSGWRFFSMAMAVALRLLNSAEGPAFPLEALGLSSGWFFEVMGSSRGAMHAEARTGAPGVSYAPRPGRGLFSICRFLFYELLCSPAPWQTCPEPRCNARRTI